ncbi:hypothetical protein HZS_6695 [Henneguya salminicola]|nr:hypothetical protein HZS_6695 [Henneguya salminicola]
MLNRVNFYFRTKNKLRKSNQHSLTDNKKILKDKKNHSKPKIKQPIFSVFSNKINFFNLKENSVVE